MHTVLIYSGGLDSTVLLYHLRAQGASVHAMSVDYGQRHLKELDSAHKIASRLGIEHRVVDLSSLGSLLLGSALTNRQIAVPQGHYTEPTMKSTVVPNRNMMLLSLAGAWAISLKAETISYAAHAGDHAIYPDCRPEFAAAMDQALGLADWSPLRLERPFVDLTKADIVKRGQELRVPFEDTWSCYQGGEVHCGCCGTCIERREAFHLAGVEDPTVYASEAPSLDDLIECNWHWGPEGFAGESC